MNKVEPVELKIEKLSLGGDGIARKDGLVYFVPMTAPGDLILAQVLETKKNFAKARLTKILEPSPNRIEAPCKYYGECGGCNWQHLDYPTQVAQKDQIVKEQLRSFANDKAQFLPIISSPKDFRYRNRIQLKYKKPHLGFFARRSHSVVDIEDCLICEEPVADAFSKARKMVGDKKLDEVPKIELLLNPQSENVEISFEDSPFDGVGFSQVNRFQNENLIAKTIEWALEGYDPSAPYFYDLYAGAGNFTFPLIEKLPKCESVAVELSEKSVKLAHEKMKALKFAPKKLRFFVSDVELFLKRNPLQKNSLVLIDPPRVGCSENTIKYLAQQQINRILYISCNPSALARDIQRLKQFSKQNWRLTRVQPFDMFPQTDHVEVLAELIVDTQG